MIAKRAAKTSAKKKKGKPTTALVAEVFKSLEGGLRLCEQLDPAIQPDKDELQMLRPFAKKIAKVFRDADKDRKVWQTKLAEGVGNTFGINQQRTLRSI